MITTELVKIIDIYYSGYFKFRFSFKRLMTEKLTANRALRLKVLGKSSQPVVRVPLVVRKHHVGGLQKPYLYHLFSNFRSVIWWCAIR